MLIPPHQGVNDTFIFSLVDECLLPSHTFIPTQHNVYLFMCTVRFFFFWHARSILVRYFPSKAAGWDSVFVSFLVFFDQHVTCTTPQ